MLHWAASSASFVACKNLSAIGLSNQRCMPDLKAAMPSTEWLKYRGGPGDRIDCRGLSQVLETAVVRSSGQPQANSSSLLPSRFAMATKEALRYLESLARDWAPNN